MSNYIYSESQILFVFAPEKLLGHRFLRCGRSGSRSDPFHEPVHDFLPFLSADLHALHFAFVFDDADDIVEKVGFRAAEAELGKCGIEFRTRFPREEFEKFLDSVRVRFFGTRVLVESFRSYSGNVERSVAQEEERESGIFRYFRIHGPQRIFEMGRSIGKQSYLPSLPHCRPNGFPPPKFGQPLEHVDGLVVEVASARAVFVVTSERVFPREPESDVSGNPIRNFRDPDLSIRTFFEQIEVFEFPGKNRFQHGPITMSEAEPAESVHPNFHVLQSGSRILTNGREIHEDGIRDYFGKFRQS